MKMVKWLAKIVSALIIILAIGGYVAARSFDLNQYKSYVEEIVQRELGRQLTISGDAHLGISLVPTVIVNDVALANPSWARNPQLIKVKQLEVKIALLPLLKKQIVIDKVLLDTPEIYPETSANGVQSWDFSGKLPAAAKSKAESAAPVSASPASSGASASSAAAALAGFAAKQVAIENGVIDYYNAAANDNQIVEIKQITFSAPSVQEEMTAAFDVLYNGQKISGEMTLGALQTLLENKEPYPFTITADALLSLIHI